MYSLLVLIVQRTVKLIVEMAAKKQVIGVTGLKTSAFLDYKCEVYA